MLCVIVDCDEEGGVWVIMIQKRGRGILLVLTGYACLANEVLEGLR